MLPRANEEEQIYKNGSKRSLQNLNEVNKMTWFNTLKEDKNKQGKLPKELVEGAHVSKVPIEQWFKKKPSKSKPQKLDDSTKQISLDRYTEE